MYIGADQLQITNAGITEAQAKFFADGACELNYNNVKKFETASYGVGLTGNVRILNDNDSLQIGASQDLRLYHDGSTSIIFSDNSNISVRAKSGENSILIKPDMGVELYYDDAKKINTLSTGMELNGIDTYVEIKCLADGTARGYIYANNSNHIGFLNNSGSWSYRVESDGDYQHYGSSISDRDRKDNITTISGTSLDKVTKLVPKTFTWKQDNSGKVPTDKVFTGFIAQEVKEHLPDIVKGTDGQKNMAVDYNGILAHAVKAITELSAEVETLKTKVAALEAA